MILRKMDKLFCYKFIETGRTLNDRNAGNVSQFLIRQQCQRFFNSVMCSLTCEFQIPLLMNLTACLHNFAN